MPQYPVFASYAQKDREKHLDTFIKELGREISNQLPDVGAAEVVFFDRVSVQAGDKWNDVILDAVCKADVLICLMSPAYFTRPWCGRELEVFLQRCAIGGDHVAPRTIIPVWWVVPDITRPVPAKLAQFHHKDGDFPPNYVTDGIRGLLRKRFKKQVIDVVDRLKKIIVEALHHPHRLPVQGPIVNVEDLANPFDEQQPHDTKLVILKPEGLKWKPDAAGPELGTIVERTALRRQLYIRLLPTDSAFGEALLDARDEKQLIFVIVDAADSAYAQLQQINGIDLPDLVVLLVSHAPSTAAMDQWLQGPGLPQGSLRKARDEGRLHMVAYSALHMRLEGLILENRQRMISGLKQSAVTGRPDLEAAVANQGISLQSLPTLAGPGSGSTI